MGAHEMAKIEWRYYCGIIITPATKYINVVIPAKAGIQAGTGCRIKPGMAE